MANEEKTLEGILVGFVTIEENSYTPTALSLLVKTDDNELIYGYHIVNSKLFGSYGKVLKEGQRIKLWDLADKDHRYYNRLRILSEPTSTQPQ